MERFPDWLRRQLPSSSTHPTQEIVHEFGLNTVCESCHCPNRLECWASRTATFMLLGNICTRACRFCAVNSGVPEDVDPSEPARVARAANQLGLEHVVITSVTRDDLSDEGAGQFAKTISAVRALMPQATIEVLTPDFHARTELVKIVCDARPDVFNHNVETVERLSAGIRPQADYQRSLELLRTVREICPEMTTKSGLMLGLGETREDVRRTMEDLRSADCDVLTIGQYLRPKAKNIPVVEFAHPDVFSAFEILGKQIGFREVFAGPYVRSSYRAAEAFRRMETQKTEVVTHA